MMDARPRQDAAALRTAFDNGFAESVVSAPALHDILAIETAGRPFAIRVAEIAGLFADRVLTPLPSRRTDLLGLAGFRGVIVPVFDLAALLGGAASKEPPRWIVVAKRASVGFAFDRFVAHLRVTDVAIATDLVRTDEILRPLLAIAALLDATTPSGNHGDS